jgi:hypothetical protein
MTLAKLFRVFVTLLLVGLTSSCAKNLYVNYQAEPYQTSAIVLKPSKISHKTCIFINDSLVVENKNVKTVTISNVPSGEYKIKYKSRSGWYKEKLNSNITMTSAGDGKTIVKKVEVPQHSGWYWVCVSSVVVWPVAILAGLVM